MATFSAAGNVSGYDFRQFNLARLDTAEVISASSSFIRGQIVPNQYLDLTGSFAYDSGGFLVGNSLSGYSEVMNGITLWSFSGLGMSVYNFASYYYFNDNAGFLNEALNGNDTITGSNYNDYLIGLGGHDIIYGGDGNDWIDGGDGSDALYGGEGNDTYLYDGFGSITDTGASTGDTIISTTIDLNLAYFPGVENVTLVGAIGRFIDGSAANNTLIGNASDNSIAGYGGNDILYGGGGADGLNGGPGNDIMYGGLGSDGYSVDSAADVVSEEDLNILWRNKLTGENHVWAANGINIVNGTDLDVAYVPLGWEIVGTADFNRDGISDILWRNSQSGENHLWHMNGTAPSGVNLSVPVIPLAWKIVATADFNRDGYADILWRNSQTGENHLWHMNDATVVSGQNLSRAVIPLEWDVVGAADFNNDGHTDILWRNGRTGENHLWYMNDTTYLSGVNLSVPVIPLAWQIQALTDFNSDGNVDILWRNSQTGENHVWYMNNATVMAGYNLSVAAVSLDWDIVGAIGGGGWGGTDKVTASTSFTLPEGVENLELESGIGNFAITGNSSANILIGNNGNNVIDGKGGDDIIRGYVGSDTLTGGSGADRFILGFADGPDHITDFQSGPGGDTIELGLQNAVLSFTGHTITTANLAEFVQFANVGGNTEISFDTDGNGMLSGGVILTLNGVTGLDPLSMLQQGSLVLS